MNTRWLLGSAYEMLLFAAVFFSISRIKFSKLEVLIYSLGYGVINLLAFSSLYTFVLLSGDQIGIFMPVITLIYFVIVGYKKIKILSLAGFYAILMVSIPLISNMLATAIFATTGVMETFDFVAYRSEHLVLITALSIMALFSILISYFLGKMLDARISVLDRYMKEKCSKYLVWCSLFILLLLYYLTFFRWFVDTEIMGWIFLVMVAMLIISLVFAISVFTDAVKAALHAQEKEYYLTQCHLMQESVEHIKSIRHDMKIHLATINGYSTKINATEITDYTANLLNDIGEAELYSNTGNVAIDSIINYKLKNIKKDRIKPEIRLLIPTVLNIEISDLATIIGNLLDNALNAVLMLEENKEKKIKLDIEYNRESLVIQADNTFDGVVNYQEGQIITRQNKTSHGHGLKNIKKVVDRHNGYMDITHDNGIFSVAILLCVSEANK